MVSQEGQTVPKGSEILSGPVPFMVSSQLIWYETWGLYLWSMDESVDKNDFRTGCTRDPRAIWLPKISEVVEN